MYGRALRLIAFICASALVGLQAGSHLLRTGCPSCTAAAPECACSDRLVPAPPRHHDRCSSACGLVPVSKGLASRRTPHTLTWHRQTTHHRRRCHPHRTKVFCALPGVVPGMARVWVVVLGDFGRSPRMQYHTLSLSAAGYDVTVMATAGAAPITQLLGVHNVQFCYLPQPPAWVMRLPTLLGLALKAAYALADMAWIMLLAAPRPKAILLQNPPAIPTLLVCWLAAARWQAKLIIDWHNLAYSILQLKYGQRRGWLIRLARSYEFSLGRCAAAHFTVTKVRTSQRKADVCHAHARGAMLCGSMCSGLCVMAADDRQCW